MRKTIALILTVCTVFCLTACGEKPNDLTNNIASTAPSTATTTPTAPTVSVTPLHRRESTIELNKQYSPYNEAMARLGTPWESDVKLDIPVYYEADLLFDLDNGHFLHRDRSASLNLSSAPNSAFHIIVPFHPSAWRLREDGSSYVIYDTDTGYRLYIFFHKEYPMFTGFPVVINKSKILSLRDFKDIQIGDSMEDVEAIDNIVTLYKREIFEKFNFTPIAFENLKKFGTPITTIHYLKDGILAFEYTMTEEQKVLVSGITYYEDYIIKTFDGELTSHKIKDIDLPAA